MKITVYKCSTCKELFEGEKEYNLHIAKEKSIKSIRQKFPEVKDKGCKFANGDYSVKRGKKYFEDYKATIVEEVNKFKQVPIDYYPTSYAWFRTLDDSGSMFYGVACRLIRFCPKCYTEWGQAYYANKCCGGK